MQLIPVRSAGFADIPALQALYEASFPAAERRDFRQLLRMLQEPDMHLHAVMVAGEAAGLAVHWQLDSLLYLEHLAIHPAHQGRGYGKAVMQRLLRLPQTQLVLEVEPPASEAARKRIRFYEQLGLNLHPAPHYLQPPYERQGQPVPLRLMATPAIATPQEYERITSCIRQQVYERFYT